jgi:hypothetical protein
MMCAQSSSWSHPHREPCLTWESTHRGAAELSAARRPRYARVLVSRPPCVSKPPWPTLLASVGPAGTCSSCHQAGAVPAPGSNLDGEDQLPRALRPRDRRHNATDIIAADPRTPSPPSPPSLTPSPTLALAADSTPSPGRPRRRPRRAPCSRPPLTLTLTLPLP